MPYTVNNGGFIMKVTMNINDDLLKRLDSYAKANYMPRSTVMCIACNQYLMQNEIQALFTDLKQALNRISETGELDEKTKKDMTNFMEVCELMQAK